MVNKSAYQLNLQQSSEPSKQTTTRDVLKQISILGQRDKAKADEYMKKLSYSMQDASSKYYNPYTQATNKAVSTLASYGFDMSVVDDNWFNQNSWLKQYYVTTANTNGLSSTMTNKKASKEQKAAYQYNQLWQAEETTKKAEQEWAALQEELNYWANRTDRNYSDDEIIGRINWNNYKTLQKMDDGRLKGQPIELNRAIGYSKDAMYGVLYAARNGSTGNYWEDIANSANGTGWKDNPEIRAKLDIGNLGTYSPYSVGSTMEDEGLYFSRDTFDQKWLDDNRALYLGGDDETAKKMYQNVYAAEQYTQKLESQRSAMEADINDLLTKYDDPDQILSMLKDGTNDYSDLFDLDESLKSGKLKDTTRAVNYRWQDIEKKVRDACEEKNNRTTADGLVKWATGADDSQAASELESYYKSNVNASLPTIHEKGTSIEKIAASTGKTADFDAAQEALTNADIEPSKAAADVTRTTVNEYLGYVGVTFDFEQHQGNLERLQTEKASNDERLKELRERKAAATAVAGATQEELARIQELANTPSGQNGDWDWAKVILNNPNSDPSDVEGALNILYQNVTGNMLSMYSPEVASGELEKAKKWFDYMNSDNRSPMDLLTDEENRELMVLESEDAEISKQIDQEESYLSTNLSAYEEAQMSKQFLSDAFSTAASVSNGEMDATLLPTIEAAYILGKTPIMPSYYSDSVLDVGVREGQMTREQATDEAIQTTVKALADVEGLKDLLDVVKKYNIPISDEQRKNIEARITESQNNAKSAAYVALDGEEDFRSVVDQTVKAVKDSYNSDTKKYDTGKYGYLAAAILDADNNLLALEYETSHSLFGEKRAKAEAFHIAWLMTQEERDRYMYLLGKDGKEEADKYISLLTNEKNGAITIRNSERNSQLLRDLASNNGVAAALLTTTSFGTKIIGGVSDIVQLINSKVFGADYKPFSKSHQFTNVTQAIRAGTKDLLTRAAGDNKTLSTALNITYDAVTSAIDSQLNAKIMDKVLGVVSNMFSNTKIGRIIDDIEFGAENAKQGIELSKEVTNKAYRFGHSKVGRATIKIANDFAHATGMGLEAAASTYNDVYIRTGDDTKASLMALATFFAETGSEAITYGNISEAFAVGNDDAKRSFTNFVKEFFKNGAEEFFGEGINQFIEDNADRLIMGAESDFAKRVAELKADGYSTTIAESIASKEAWKEILRSGATGFLSSNLGTSVSYLSGYLNDNSESEPAPVVIPGSNGMITQSDVTTQDVEGNWQREETPEDFLMPKAEQTNEYFGEEGTVNGEEGTIRDFSTNTSENILRNRVSPGEQTRINISKEIAKEADILTGAFNGDDTAAAVAISSLMGTGDSGESRATAQAMIGNLAKGRSQVAVRATQGILNTYHNMQRDATNNPEIGTVSVPDSMDALKDTMSFAALTNGQGHQALQRIFHKAQRGMEITQENIMDVFNGVQADRNSDRVAGTDIFERQYFDALREYRISNYTVRNMASKEMRDRVAPAEEAVRTARNTLDNTRKAAKEAHDKVDTVSQNLTAAENEYNPKDPSQPVNQEAAGTHEQTMNELAGAITDADTADNAVVVQEQKLEKEKKKLNDVRDEAMAESRANAEQAVQQEETAKQQVLQEQQATFPSTVPLKRSVRVKLNNKQQTEITGVFAVNDDTTIYSTPNGYVSEDQIDNKRESQEVLDAVDVFTDGKAKNTINPAVWFGHSLQATVDNTGDTVTIVGIAGQDAGDAVLMDSNGRTYSLDDLTMQADPFTGGDGEQSFFDMTDNLDYNTLPSVSKKSDIKALHSSGNSTIRSRQNAQNNQTPTAKQANKVKEKLVSPQQIALNLAKNLGFGSYTSNKFGSGKLSRARGYWSNHAELLAIKPKDAGRYNVTMHEIGHGIAEKLGLTGTQQMIDNMIREDRKNSPNGKSVFETSYKPQELPDEAMAEFMWRYMEGEERARDFAGDAFYDSFERALNNNPDMANAVSEARSQLQSWINATTSERVQSMIRWENSGGRQSLRNAIRTVINEVADSSSIAEEVNAFIRQAKGVQNLAIEDNLRAQSLLSNHSQKVALQNLTDFLTDSDRTIRGVGMAKRMADTGFVGTEENIHLLEEYALLKHSLDRDEQAKAVFGDMSREEREARIKEIENTRKDIVDAEAAWQSFRHDFLQEWMVNTGYWSQEFFDNLEKMYPHYVPTFRVRGDVDAMKSIGSGRGAKKFTLHEATGGSQDIFSPYYSFIGMVDQIVGMVNTNKVAQTFDRLYQENKGMGDFGRLIPESEIPSHIIPKAGLNARQTQLQEILGDKISNDLMEQVLDITKSRPGIKSQSGNDVLTVQRADGTTVQYEIDNPELFKLLTGAHGSVGIHTLQAVAQLTRAMTMLTTGSNPLFALRNATRDFQNSVNFGSYASNYLTGAKIWVQAFNQVWHGSEDFDAYKALGGGGWTRIQQNDTKSMKQIQSEMFGDDKSTLGKTAKWAGKKLWNTVTLARLNEMIEQTSRFAEYKYGKHDLTTAEGRQEAFLAAQDATVDFSRSGNGELAYVLKRIVPFFNASLQGVYRTGRQLTQAERGTNGETIGETLENFKGSRAAARLAKTVINTGLASALAAGLIFKFGDDDDKEEFMMLSDGVKANHLILPNPIKGEGQPPFIRIPLAQDPLGYAIHNLVTNLMTEGPEDELGISLAATADVILDNINPLGSGTIFQPFVDVSHNRTWYGSALVRNNQSDWADPSSQYNEDTPELFKAIGRLINTSPEIVEYLAGQYTGFLGAMVTPALSKDSDGSLGGLHAILDSIVKKWTADPASSSDVTSNFYDMKKVLNTIVEEAKADRPQGLLLSSLTQEQVNQAYSEADKMLKSGGIVYETNKLINETYKKIDAINGNATLSDTEKDELTRKAKLDMLKRVELVNETLMGYQKKYMTGETLADRIFGGFEKRVAEGKYAHIPTDIEKLPVVFNTNDDYMLKSQEVYNTTGKASALPHPSQSFTAKDRSGIEQDYIIPDNEWDHYTSIYKDQYERYMTSKGGRWDSMSLEQKQKVLQGAHTAANKAMKEAYLRSQSGR